MSIKSTYLKPLYNLRKYKFGIKKQSLLSSVEINQLVKEAMSILDEEIPISEDLTERILAKKPVIPPSKVFRINFSDYAQIAAVLAIGVVLGVVLGKNADTNILLSKDSKKKKILIEYRNSHYLTVDRTFFLK